MPAVSAVHCLLTGPEFYHSSIVHFLYIEREPISHINVALCIGMEELSGLAAAAGPDLDYLAG